MNLTDLPPVPGVEHRDVDVNGVRLHVAEAGDGPPLILLHGWPQHWWSWRHLIPRLAQDYRVLAPDLRGWGWSDAPRDSYAKLTFATDVIALLDAEGLDRVKVIGHDWGGYTAFLLALEYPGRIERMVTLDIPPPWAGPRHLRQLALPVFLAYQVLVASPGLGPWTMTSSNLFIRTIIRGGSARTKKWSDQELDVYAAVLREPARAAASSACYRTFLTRELPETLAWPLPTARPQGADAPRDGFRELPAMDAGAGAGPQPPRRDDRRRRPLPARGSPGGGSGARRPLPEWRYANDGLGMNGASVPGRPRTPSAP